MTNLEKFNNVFVEVFAVDDSVLNNSFSRETTDAWDSVHQLNIVSLLEEAFDIMLEAEDILTLTSYSSGKVILKKYDIEI